LPVLNVISFNLFVIFIVSYCSKLVILNKKSGIKALVLAKGKKGKSIDSAEYMVQASTFVWGALWLAESFFSSWAADYLPYFYGNQAMRSVGLILDTIGLIFFISSMITMKTSWRVGIDKSTTTRLITNGLYQYSRNPAFVGFNLMFIGLFAAFPNLATLIICLLNMLAVHKLILQEEKHLEEMPGEEYVQYRNQTPRYLFF
jgi:protein-S-isoprenylcysteine O-methyltransferase Ste14